MPHQIVQYQEHSQRRWFGWQCDAHLQALLPTFPQRATLGRWSFHNRRQASHNLAKFGLKPGQRHVVGAVCHPFDADLPISRVKQCQQFRRSIAHILVRIARWFALLLPGLGLQPEQFGMDRLRPRTTRPSRVPRLVYTPARSNFFCLGVGICYHAGPLLSHAHDLTSFTPTPVALPTQASVVEHSQDGKGRDTRKIVWGTSQCALQRGR